jgi:hypothetical protein
MITRRMGVVMMLCPGFIEFIHGRFSISIQGIKRNPFKRAIFITFAAVLITGLAVKPIMIGKADFSNSLLNLWLCLFINETCSKKARIFLLYDTHIAYIPIL